MEDTEYTLIINTLSKLYDFDVEEATLCLAKLNLVPKSLVLNDMCSCVVCLSGSAAGKVYQGLCKCKTTGFHLECHRKMMERGLTT